MNKKKIRTILCVLLAAAGLTAAGALAAGGAGSQSDPLVTLSYLTETFTGQIMDKVDDAIARRTAQLLQELGGGSVSNGTASAYSTVTLTAGQTLSGEAGCEVLLRSGSAACGGTGTASMTDATTGGSLNGGGALEGNHLYLMPESQSVFTAEGAVLLVRGSFIIGS